MKNGDNYQVSRITRTSDNILFSQRCLRKLNLYSYVSVAMVLGLACYIRHLILLTPRFCGIDFVWRVSIVLLCILCLMMYVWARITISLPLHKNAECYGSATLKRDLQLSESLERALTGRICFAE